jgi:putative membrane protein
MPQTLAPSLATLPDFLAYFALAVVLAVLFLALYVWITPHRELTLIRADKPAAAISFGGAFLGFVIPLASAISHSVGLVDCAIWGLIALIVQALTFYAVRLLLPDLPARIERDERAAGILVAALSIGVGVLNAACMTW